MPNPGHRKRRPVPTPNPLIGRAVEAAASAVVVGALALAERRGSPPASTASQEVTPKGPVFGVKGTRARAPAPQRAARDWRAIARRTLAEFNADHIAIISAGVTFNIVLAIFPALAAFVSLYGLVGDVGDAPRQLETMAVVLPKDILTFIAGEMRRLAQARNGGLSLALLGGVAFSLWSANRAMKAMFVGLNVAFEEHETRGFVRLTLTSLAFTLALIVFVVATAAALAAGAVAGALLGPEVGLAVSLARWPVLLLAFAGVIACLYRFGPSRPVAPWRWISWGSGAATVAWIGASLLFSVYMSRFAHYDRTYGALGTAIGLMVWIWLSVIVVLLGAELDAELDRRAPS